MRRNDALKKAEDALLKAERDFQPESQEAWASIGYGWICLANELGQPVSSMPPPPLRGLRGGLQDS